VTRKNTAVPSSALGLAIVSALAGVAVASPAFAQEAAGAPANEAELRQLTADLAELKAAYAQEVRRLRELDML
jgi:hypothetical protein